MSALLEEATTRRIIRAFYDVYGELGHGFLESVYQEALARRCAAYELSVEREVPLDVYFQADRIGVFRADMIVDRSVIVEVKAVNFLVHEHYQQLTNYLRATRIEVGLLLNFGPKAQFRRAIFTNDRRHSVSSAPIR